MKKHLYVTLIILFFLISQHKLVHADSFRCNNKIVKAGDTTVEVKIKCGKPFEIENIGLASGKK
jgi:hypothetical protein